MELTSAWSWKNPTTECPRPKSSFCTYQVEFFRGITGFDSRPQSVLTGTTPTRKLSFRREVLEIHKSDGLNNLGGIKWSLALCCFFVYVVVYFALWKGPRSSGKVCTVNVSEDRTRDHDTFQAVWITATAPYVVLMILLVHGATLPGAADGVYYYLTPQWESLKQTSVRSGHCYFHSLERKPCL